MTLAPSLTRVFTDTTGMALRKNQEYGTATISTLAENDDMVSQVFTPTALSTLTPYEYGAQFLLTDQRMESDPFGVRQDAALELGGAMAESIDKNVFSNFSSLTGGTVGASGTTITWGYVYAMLALLRRQKAPLTKISFVCTASMWRALAKEVSTASSSATNAPETIRAEVSRNYFVRREAGFDIYVSENCPLSSTDAYCAMFHPLALAYDERRAPRLEPERDASRRAWQFSGPI